VQRKEGGRRRKERDTVADRWDPPVGAAEKEKEKGEGKWVGWAVWAEKVRCEVLFFFLFLFQTSFSNPF
jgi:hypothetical protein